jgi:hypothetical protein
MSVPGTSCFGLSYEGSGSGWKGSLVLVTPRTVVGWEERNPRTPILKSGRI